MQISNQLQSTSSLFTSNKLSAFHPYSDKGDVFSGPRGQFRLPFVGGLVAPNQGFFPEYDAGLFSEGSTNMIVSRGVGNSIIPLRFNNRPEIVLVTLHNMK